MKKLNKTRYAVLGTLSEGPASGYDIKIMMQKSTHYFWKEGDSSIYPILTKLLAEKLVTYTVANASSGKPKKVYAITKAGMQELQEWLIKDPEPAPSRNELLLKVFFGRNVKPDVIINHIKNVRHSVEVKLQEYHAIDPKKQDQYQFLTVRAGILHSEYVIKWCDEALALLTKK